MARDFDYNNFDDPEIVQPIPVQDQNVGRDLDRDDQFRVRRRQSSRSRSLDDQYDSFSQERPGMDAAPLGPVPSRNNNSQRNNYRNNPNRMAPMADNSFDNANGYSNSNGYEGTNGYRGDNGYRQTNNFGGNNGYPGANGYDNSAPFTENNNRSTAGASRSGNNGSDVNFSGNTSRGNNRNNINTQRPQQQRRSSTQGPSQQRQAPVRKSFKKWAIVEFFKDSRTHKFLGVLLIVMAALVTIFTFSHFKNATADQAATVTYSVAQIAQQPDLVENAGGPVGAKTGHFLITRALGLGSLVVIAYLVFLGLGLLGLRKIQFWSLTFKCLLIAITTSVVLGFIFEKASTGIYWGGEHGLAVNGWIHDRLGWIGQAAASFLLIAAVIIVYSEELARFIKRQKEIYQARRQRLAFEQDQELRRQQAVDESLSSIGDDEYDAEEYSESQDQYQGDSLGGQSSQTYTPQDQFDPNNQAYQPQEEEADNAPSIRDGFALSNEIEGMVSSPSGTSSNAANDQQGANPQSKPATVSSAKSGVPFAIDEQNIETVPVSINVVGDSSEENVPMEVSVNDIETVDVNDIEPDYDPTAELSRYHKPSLDLLVEHSSSTISVDAEEMEANKQMIITTLRNYGIEISSIEATVGPTVTLFEVVPADGVRISAIKRLEDDIARSLSAIGIRIITPMPGKNTVGLEVPNRVPQIVSMRSILTSRAYQETKARLPMAMGTTITNEVFIEDLTKMPHLLVAGATGQGKSVGLNAIITSLLYKKHPSELKFVMVDPKMVEFSLYSKIEKHFLAKLPEEEDPIITDCDKVKQTLNSLCIEMDDRYALLKDAFVRSLEEYNAKFVKHRLNPEKGHRYLPYIVVVVDEFADLIMMAGKDIETPIARIAQKARAVGIHLIIATQRPSTNVITGIIKANFPGRIAFKVSQMVDSRTILDRTGANQLIGKGDMLVMRDGKLERVQCAYVSTEEVEAICDDISSQVGYDHAYYLPEPTENQGGMNGGDLGGPGFGDRDSMFEECARFIVMQDTASTSMLQRRFSIGYNKAGRIMDQLEAAGIVSAANGQKPRMVLVDPDQLENMLANI